MWDSIRNYQARNMMRDDMRIGDEVFFYHSNCKEPAVVGISRVVSDPYPDPTQFDKKSKYYDPKSNKDKPRGADNVAWYTPQPSRSRHFSHHGTLVDEVGNRDGSQDADSTCYRQCFSGFR